MGTRALQATLPPRKEKEEEEEEQEGGEYNFAFFPSSFDTTATVTEEKWRWRLPEGRRGPGTS